MWEVLPEKKTVSLDRPYMLAWMEESVLTSQNLSRAKELVLQSAKRVPAIGALEHIPQSPPWHTEGMVVARHIERILCGVYAIAGGAVLTHVEEFARHKSLNHEVLQLQRTIQEHAATLQAYALLHDLGKADTVSFETPEGSKGAIEGFVQHSRRVQKTASEQEKQVYLKLARAKWTSMGDASEAEAMAAFYDEFEIRSHFYGHANIGAGRVYDDAREVISDMLRLSEIERRMLTFCIRYHIETIGYFNKKPNPKKIEVLTARATKAGLDAGDVLDVLVAAIFLDTGIGSLHYADGVFDVDLRPTVNFLLSEELALPGRRVARREQANVVARKAFKEILREANLEPDIVFSLLGTPHGPERGEVMDHIYKLVSDASLPVDFGRHTNDLAPRIAKARTLFDPASHLVRE